LYRIKIFYKGIRNHRAESFAISVSLVKEEILGELMNDITNNSFKIAALLFVGKFF
jgi:hypothetical protein